MADWGLPLNAAQMKLEVVCSALNRTLKIGNTKDNQDLLCEVWFLD
jgi:hypothetical protein